MTNKEIFLRYLIDNNLLNTNYLQVDLLPERGEHMMTLPVLEELLEFPLLEAFIYTGYNYEIRMNRYFIILVDEFSKVKKDANKLKNESINLSFLHN
jgi:hypothetical protein